MEEARGASAAAQGSATFTRPEVGEYDPYYAGYIALVPPGDVLAHLAAQAEETAGLLAGLSAEAGDFSYAPGKWSVKELAGHLADSERIFAYRALRIARGDSTPLAGFEQDDYVRAAGFAARPLGAIAAELSTARLATLSLFGGFDAPAAARRGTANDKPVTVRALAYIIAGHERHHLAILRERYLPAITG